MIRVKTTAPQQLHDDNAQINVLKNEFTKFFYQMRFPKILAKLPLVLLLLAKGRESDVSAL